MGDQTTFAPSQSLIALPPELLHQIFVYCAPSDLAALSLSHRTLHYRLRSAPHLWRLVYLQLWDHYDADKLDKLLRVPCPSTRSLTSVVPALSSSSSSSTAQASSKGGEKDLFDFAEQVKRRTWAEKQIGKLADRPIDLYANYNETLRALISIARSRQARTVQPLSDPLHGQDGSSSRHASADYLTSLLSSPTSIGNFRHLVYPRPDVKALHHWQMKELIEKSASSSRTTAQRGREDKRARSSSSVSNPQGVSKRSRTSSTNAAARALTNTITPPRRRSARVQLHAYPPEVHHLLHDKKTLNPITLDDGTGLADLRAMAMLDEQLAAELHVLHGIHPGFVPKKVRSGARASSARSNESQPRHASENSEESDALFVDHGTPSESQLSETMTEAMETEDDVDDEEEDDDDDDNDEVDNNVFRFFVDQLDLRRQHREPALGSGLGHTDNVRLRGRAREIVYDTARFGPENSYGPLRAWRERWEPLDGPRVGAGRDDDEDDNDDDDDDDEEEEEDDIDEEGLTGDDPEVVEIDDTSEEHDEHDQDDTSTEIAVEEEEEREELATLNTSFAREAEEGEEDEDEDEDFAIDHDHEHDHDHDDDDDDDSDLPHIFFEIREMAISHSRGIMPYHESKYLKGSMSPAVEGDSDDQPDSAPALMNVWKTGKRVDWEVVEAIMIVMYCNIRHAVLSHGWGLAFDLPSTRRSLVGRDDYSQRIYPEGGSLHERAWRNLVGLPCGWSHSRGTVDARAEHGDPEKPHDWAGVESTWIGTYAFLDWSKWAAFNARDPLSRGLIDPTDGIPTLSGASVASTPSLEGEREALGDCLQLRMELLPLAEQKPRNDADSVISYMEGYDTLFVDETKNEILPPSGPSTPRQQQQQQSTCQKEQQVDHYPPLRFRGHTRTYLDQGPPIPRGELHGIVRPVYADTEEKFEGKKAIVALHWDITHRYDGEDAWSLSGIQPGPPGTRAPIYGIWGSAARRDNLSPCGPWTYYKVDERSWRETDQ